MITMARAEPGARKFFRVSHVGAGFQGFGLSLTAFPGHKQGAGWETGLLGLEPMPISDPDVCEVRTVAARLLLQVQYILLFKTVHLDQSKVHMHLSICFHYKHWHRNTCVIFSILGKKRLPFCFLFALFQCTSKYSSLFLMLVIGVSYLCCLIRMLSSPPALLRVGMINEN